MFSRKKALVGRTVVDLVEYRRLTANGMSVWLQKTQTGKTYAVTSVEGKTVQLSHFVAGAPPIGMVKDHKDADTMNNRRSNLRDASRRQNAQNKAKKEGCTSKYIGIYWKKRNQKWQAQGPGGEYLGLFDRDQEIEGAKAYDSFVLSLLGPDAKVNGLLSPEEVQVALSAPEPIVRTSQPRRLPKGVYLTATSKGKVFLARWRDEDNGDHSQAYATVAEAEARYKAEVARVAAVKEQRHLATPIARNSRDEAVILTNQSSGKQHEIRVSEEHWHKLARYSWHWSGQQSEYPRGFIRGESVYMHHYVWGLAHPGQVIPEGHEVDHKDHDLSDLRTDALRLVTKSQNRQNKRKREGCSSDYLGVTYDEDRGKYYARIKINGKLKRLPGRFEAQEDAALQYNLAVEKHFPGGRMNVVPPRAQWRPRKRPAIDTQSLVPRSEPE